MSTFGDISADYAFGDGTAVLGPPPGGVVALVAIEGKEQDPEHSLRFHLMPQTISSVKSAVWNEIPIVGRSEPLRVYAGSTPRVFTFELTFANSIEQDDDGDETVVARQLAFLESLVYPVQTGEFGFVTTPPVLRLVVGKYLSARCVCKDVAIRLGDVWTVRTDTKPSDTPGRSQLIQTLNDGKDSMEWPMYASANVVFEEVNLVPLSYASYRDLSDRRFR